VAEADGAPRTAGWAPVERVTRSGEPAAAAALEAAVAHEGRVDALTHGFHTYPAGLHPGCAEDLLALTPPGRLMDPFCGGGTTLVAGRAAGRAVIGADLSPIARLVAATRTWSAPAEAITAMRSAARRITAEARAGRGPEQVDARLQGWYHPHVAFELTRLLRGVRAVEDDAVRRALTCCFSSILVKTSHRASDTSRRVEVRERAPGTASVLFHKKARELGRRLEALAAAAPPGAPDAVILDADARDLPPGDPVAAVVTSPPYPGVYDYLPLQTLRVIWLGVDDSAARRFEIGARRAFRADRRRALVTWRRDTARWTARAAEALAPGGRMAVVVGDGMVGEKLVDARQPSEEAAAAAGLRLVARASGARRDPARGAVRWEHALLWERP